MLNKDKKAIVNFWFLLFLTFAFQFRYLHENRNLIYYEELRGNEGLLLSPGLC